VIVTRQINHAENRNSGYDKKGIVFTIMQGDVEKNYGLIRNELLQSGAVSSVTKTMGPISQKWSDSWGFSWTGSTEADKKTDFLQFSTDAGLVATMNMSLIQGRDIDVFKYPTDSTAVLITEKAKEAMHLKDPIGALLKAQGREWHIVGVIKSFIIESPYDNILPMIIYGPKLWFNAIHYKLNPAHGTKENLDKIEAVFKKYNADYPFDYHFVDGDYAKKFEETQRVGALSALFAGLSIFISCLGLLGLIIFIAETKTKEIGVRKVLGASVIGITTLLSKEFLKLIAISFAIAAPVAWWAMRLWLMNYTYRVTIQWWWFLFTGAASLAIALATLSYHAIRAATANPVKALRSE
ncbi:MAG: ABC transporter permease, partial [Niabella sp.]|nr:ABC transporter permease [Niabella sp.]